MKWNASLLSNTKSSVSACGEKKIKFFVSIKWRKKTKRNWTSTDTTTENEQNLPVFGMCRSSSFESNVGFLDDWKSHLFFSSVERFMSKTRRKMASVNQIYMNYRNKEILRTTDIVIIFWIMGNNTKSKKKIRNIYRYK